MSATALVTEFLLAAEGERRRAKSLSGERRGY